MQEAESRAQNEMFARSNRARAFARCMGDDMASSTAGFRDPFSDGTVSDESDPLAPGNAFSSNKRRRKNRQQSDDVIWSEESGGSRDFEVVF